MNIKGIISISGQPGLFKIVTQAKYGLIAESLLDGRRAPVYASQKVSTLEDISIYTNEDDMPLKDVLARIRDKENGGPAPDAKSDTEKLKSYFGEVLPEYDRERVYVSDIKKVIGWYNLLQEKDLLNVPEEKEETEETTEVSKKAAAEEKEEKETPAKKTAKKTTKKSAAKKTSATAPKDAGKKAAGKASGAARSGGRKSTGTTRKTGGK